MPQPYSRIQKVQTWETGRLEDHIALINRQVEKSMGDPETRQLAVRIVSGVVDWMRDPRTGGMVPIIPAWGRFFRAPPGSACPARDSFARYASPVSPSEACEIQNIWDFAVLNIRYVEDPNNADLYATVQRSLEAGGSDCDDFSILFASLFQSIGYNVSLRVISVDGQYWAHIYTLIHLPKVGPLRYFFPLDPTEPGRPVGWHYPNPAAQRDFAL